MRVVGKGILQHHFWGKYYAGIGIEFDNEYEAGLALGSGKLHSEFKLGEKSQKVLTCFVDSETLDVVVENLVSLGAKKEAIASVAHSIDYGDDWTIELDVEDPRQGRLF